jgi:hypothetical protein
VSGPKEKTPRFPAAEVTSNTDRSMRIESNELPEMRRINVIPTESKELVVDWSSGTRV